MHNHPPLPILLKGRMKKSRKKNMATVSSLQKELLFTKLFLFEPYPFKKKKTLDFWGHCHVRNQSHMLVWREASLEIKGKRGFSHLHANAVAVESFHTISGQSASLNLWFDFQRPRDQRDINNEEPQVQTRDLAGALWLVTQRSFTGTLVSLRDRRIPTVKPWLAIWSACAIKILPITRLQASRRQWLSFTSFESP